HHRDGLAHADDAGERGRDRAAVVATDRPAQSLRAQPPQRLNARRGPFAMRGRCASSTMTMLRAPVARIEAISAFTRVFDALWRNAGTTVPAAPSLPDIAALYPGYEPAAPSASPHIGADHAAHLAKR